MDMLEVCYTVIQRLNDVGIDFDDEIGKSFKDFFFKALLEYVCECL